MTNPACAIIDCKQARTLMCRKKVLLVSLLTLGLTPELSVILFDTIDQQCFHALNIVTCTIILRDYVSDVRNLRSRRDQQW